MTESLSKGIRHKGHRWVMFEIQLRLEQPERDQQASRMSKRSHSLEAEYVPT